MKLKGIFSFVGMQDLQGKKDPTKMFHNIVLMQGIDVQKIFVNDDVAKQFAGIKPMDNLECDLSISIGHDRSYIGLDSFRKI